MNFFSLLFYSTQQTNQIRPFVFLGESTARQSAFLKLTDLYYDPQSARINVQSPLSESTPRRLTLGLSLMLLQRNIPLRFIST